MQREWNCERVKNEEQGEGLWRLRAIPFLPTPSPFSLTPSPFWLPPLNFSPFFVHPRHSPSPTLSFTYVGKPVSKTTAWYTLYILLPYLLMNIQCPLPIHTQFLNTVQSLVLYEWKQTVVIFKQPLYYAGLWGENLPVGCYLLGKFHSVSLDLFTRTLLSSSTKSFINLCELIFLLSHCLDRVYFTYHYPII